MATATDPPHVVDDVGIDKRRLQRRRCHGCGVRAGHREAGAYCDCRDQGKQDFAHEIFSLGVVVGTRGPHSQQALTPAVFLEDYTNSAELRVGSAFMWGSCGTAG
jgi:hypothetical protein